MAALRSIANLVRICPGCRRRPLMHVAGGRGRMGRCESCGWTGPMAPPALEDDEDDED